jgi:hypothetical protein
MAFGTAYEEPFGISIESPLRDAFGEQSCIPISIAFGAAL